ncbi:hypothetical protein H0H93_005457 [Arthromyces matolae]|nr:hypothetical protein H0H93_005457 [Arthromyces matolae]
MSSRAGSSLCSTSHKQDQAQDKGYVQDASITTTLEPKTSPLFEPTHMPPNRGTDDYGAKPKKKRSKGGRKPTSGTTLGLFKNVRGRRGALKGIVEMPLDILYESFMYLTSVEVLHLSRTCKALRRILMTKSAECVWKQARYNLDDFPDRLDDLNEPQLAAFVFSALCDVRP